jgi:ELWxxDGT repeat protein
LTNVNGTLFFQADDGTHGVELWESNGTGAGTFMVQDINPGPGSSNPQNLTNVNGILFFSANDGTHGVELWESIDSGAATFLVQDIHPGTSGSYPYHLTNVNGTLFFSAEDGTHARDLWESNPTSGATFVVSDTAYSPYYLTNVNGTLFFQAFDSNHGAELWESDGFGASLVQDINPGTGGSQSYDLTNVNGTLFFSANDGTHGAELWESDGTATGTFLVKDINPGFGSGSNPYFLTNVNGTLFFTVNDGTHGFELWESNGTAEGTFLVQDIRSGASSSDPSFLTNVNGELFFSADDGIHGRAPWILVSTATTTSLSSTPNPSAFGQAVTLTATISAAAGVPSSPVGTVDFKEGSTDLSPGGVSLTNGQATFSIRTLAAGSHTITAVYSDDSFTGSQGDDSANPLVVQKDSTSITLIGPSTLVSGQPAAFVAVVANTSGPFGSPTGQVQFAVDGTKLGSPVTLVGGVAASLPTKLSATGGPHTITATYTNSDGDFVGSSKSVTQAASKDGTRMILVSSVNPSVFGQTVAITGAVTALAPGSGTPTGTVDFKEGATDLTPGGIALAGGRAIFRTASLSVGQHTITATYAGDANFTGTSANDSAAPQVVNQASTRTVMTSFPDPSVFGQVVSFTVAVIALAPSQGTPTGTVTFTDGTTTIGTVTVNNVSRATFTTASLSRGNHAINANYGGDARFKVSGDMGFGETVLKDATTATVTASANPAVVGTTVTLTAAVQASSPGAGIPTGTVTFLDITTTLGTGTLNAAGKATFTTSALALGNHAITATYQGDTDFSASVSALLTETVKSANPEAGQKDSTSVTLLITPSTLVSGQLVAFVAVVADTSNPSRTPTGQVQFAVDGTNLGSPLTLQNGVASHLPTTLSATSGPHTITATYINIDGNFVGSSKSVTQAVAKDGTGMALVSSANPSVFGQTIAITGTITALSAGSGTPTGTVDFKEGATDLTPGGITLAGGRAIFRTSSLSLGKHTITATYGGDANFTGASANDSAAPQVVNQASTRTVMTSFPDPSVFGQVVSFTVAVIALPPSQGTPTGTVTFTDGTTTIGTVTVNNVGRATFTTTSLSRGNHAINANYGGDAKFKASSYMGFGETVQKDATTATVTASANPAVVGTTVTLTAAVQASSPGAGSATGTVIFTDFSTALATLTLNSAGQATFTTSSLALGTHAITASYGGDNNFSASVSALVAEAIKSSTMSLTPSSALSLSGMRSTAPEPVLPTANSNVATPPAQAQLSGATLIQSGAAAQGPATWNPARLDRYFAAATTLSAARRLTQLAAPRRDATDWLDDPFAK